MRHVNGLYAAFALLLFALTGCSTSSSASGSSTIIITQPQDESVPMGLAADYSVVGNGQGLRYQWSRNGVVIPGATGSTYELPVTAFSDSGSTFSVTVTNSTGSETSRLAALTITARAPAVGDLRFQQVDAASTVHGYQLGGAPLSYADCPPTGAGGTDLWLDGRAGVPFRLSNNACAWPFDAYNPTVGMAGVSTDYTAFAASRYAYWMSIGEGPIPPPNSSGSVIFSLGKASAETDMLGAAYVHSATATGFDMQQNTVDASVFATSAAQDGLHGRVVTALYVDGSNITYLSYGWTGDSGKVYESKVLTGTLDTAASLVVQLAGEGYLVTATTCTEAADGSGVWVTGTRVQGDTMPRPVLSVPQEQLGQLQQGGYAIVASVMEFNGNSLVLNQYIGER